MFRSARFHFSPRCWQSLPLLASFHRISRTARFTLFSPSRCPASNTCLGELRESFCSWRSAPSYWLQEHGGGVITRVFLAIVTLLFPDLQAFNLVDDIVAGTAISLAVFAKTALLGLFYTTVYTLLATFVFYGREL